MLHLIDMASSPQYLAPSAHTPEHIEIDSNTTLLPDGSGSIAQPTTVAYSHPDQGPYSEISHVSPFGTSSLIDDNLLTPVSSAASPPLQPKLRSAYDHEEESLHCSQQPTPPHNATMYSPYPDYMHSTSQASSSMSMQPTVADASHEFFIQNSPGPEDAIPPPQPKLYLGAFGASNVSVAPDPDPYPGYMHHPGMDSPMGLLRASTLSDVNAGSYGHRTMAHTNMSQAPPMAALLHHSPQDPYRQIPLPRLSPSTHPGRQHNTKRDPARKAARRKRASPPMQAMYRINEEPAPPMIEDDGPDEEVTLDDNASQDLQRLWNIRKKYLNRKGNGMWEDILAEYYRDEVLASDNKKTQAKAGLQMKIHRMLLKHGVWPRRDEAALIRAYRRWEENRYIEILRFFEEEMAGRKKAYDWKSQHVEAQLVKMGFEELDRDRDSKARKRKQVAAKHSARSGAAAAAAAAAAATAAASLHQNNRLTPGVSYHEQQQQQQPQQQSQQQSSAYYGQAGPAGEHYRASPYESTQQLAQELGAHPPDLDDAQREELVSQVLDRSPFDLLEEQDDNNGEDAEAKLSDYGGGGRHHNHHLLHQHPHHQQQEQHPHGLPHPHWEARPRAGSPSLIHPALSGNSHGNSNTAGGYGGLGTSGAPSSSSSTVGGPAGVSASGGPSGGSPDPYDAQRNTPMSRSMLEETLSRSAYGAGVGA